MAKTFKFIPADIPPSRRGGSVYSEIVAEFLAQGAKSMQVQLDGVKPATLRAGLRTAIKNGAAKDVQLVQRGEVTFLVAKAS